MADNHRMVSDVAAGLQQVASGMETGECDNDTARSRIDDAIAQLQEAKNRLEMEEFDSEQFMKDDPITQAEKLSHLKKVRKLKTSKLVGVIGNPDKCPEACAEVCAEKWVRNRLSLLKLKGKHQEKVRKGDMTVKEALKKLKK